MSETGLNKAETLGIIKWEMKRILNATIFEFNDDITRSQLLDSTNALLMELKLYNLLIDYLVICDQTNNPEAVINDNKIVIDLYLKFEEKIFDILQISLGKNAQFEWKHMVTKPEGTEND